MKRTTTFWKKIMAASLLGAFTIVPVVDGISSAQAAPPPHHQNRDRGRGHDRDRDHDKNRKRDDHRKRDKDRHDRKDDNRRPGWGWGDRNHDHDKRDHDRHDRRDRDRRDRDRRDRPHYGWGQGNRSDYRTFTGVVTNSRSGDKFDIRVDGRTYNVYLSGRRPHGLDRNDVVRVYGKRVGGNDIRNASVRVLRNR